MDEDWIYPECCASSECRGTNDECWANYDLFYCDEIDASVEVWDNIDGCEMCYYS